MLMMIIFIVITKSCICAPSFLGCIFQGKDEDDGVKKGFKMHTSFGT